MRRCSMVVTAFLMIAWVGMNTSAAAAPPEPQPILIPCATEASAQVFGSTDPANADGQTMVLARVILGPGGGIDAHTHPGTLIVTVETGSLGVTMLEHGEMSVMRSQAAGTPAVPEPVAMDTEIELAPGDWIVETDMLHSGRNLSDEPTMILVSGLIAAGQPLTICAEQERAANMARAGAVTGPSQPSRRRAWRDTMPLIDVLEDC